MQRTHRAHYHHSRTIEMTSGSLWKNILLFSIPLVLTQLLEVLFNLSDVAVAGKFADYRALGAVGSTTQLVTLFTGFLIGLGSGVNVEVARSLGAEDRERTEKNIHTSFIICAAAGVLLCLICCVFARDILVLLRTKDELLEGAVLYFSIYALGMPAMAVYNFGNGVLSAAGDTKRPLLYLTISGILNVILNLFFVIKCHMAADGVAIASVIAQVLSAVMITVHLCRRDDDCRLSLSKLRFNVPSAKRVLMLGIPTGLQNAIFAVANMFVQTGVNTFDAVTVSGNSAAVNADSLIFNTQSAFYTACSSFISRNWGAGRKERILKSYILHHVHLTVRVADVLMRMGEEIDGPFTGGRHFETLFDGSLTARQTHDELRRLLHVSRREKAVVTHDADARRCDFGAPRTAAAFEREVGPGIYRIVEAQGEFARRPFGRFQIALRSRE